MRNQNYKKKSAENGHVISILYGFEVLQTHIDQFSKRFSCNFSSVSAHSFHGLLADSSSHSCKQSFIYAFMQARLS